MRNIRIAAFAGSLRAGSLNRKLLHVAVEIAQKSGAEVDVIDLKALAIPLYDGDDEAAQGLPPGAAELKRRIAAADALLVATPEYNSSVPGVLKNAIDWVSRPKIDVVGGKIALVVSASPGAFGGYRSLVHLRSILEGPFKMWVIPSQVILPKAHQAFDAEGRLLDAHTHAQLEAAVKELLATVPRFVHLE